MFKNKKIYLDGGMGSLLLSKGLSGPSELHNINNPNIVKEIHQEYISSGSNVIYTNTFGINTFKYSDEQAKTLIQAGIKIAKEASNNNCLVALDIGSMGKLIGSGGYSFEEIYNAYKKIVCFAEDKTDFIVVETINDLVECRTALLAIKENSKLPVVVSMSFENNGKTVFGNPISSFSVICESLGADALGINCSLSAKDMLNLAKELVKYTNLPIFLKPNAGQPELVDNVTIYKESPKDYALYMAEAFKLGVNAIGGCCGTNPNFIFELVKITKNLQPICRDLVETNYVASPYLVKKTDAFCVVGERINPTGKKLMQKALLDNDMAYILSLAVSQEENGADILDVNVGMNGIDESTSMKNLIDELNNVTNLPLQIDSSSIEVIECALRRYPGRAIVNSVNGKQDVLDKFLPIIKKYGAIIVGLTLDENGIPETYQEKIKIAEKIINNCLKYGFKKDEIIIDCLTMSEASKAGNAINTLNALRGVKKLGVKTVLGVSNISFGMPKREIINATFLEMSKQAGLDFAIINPSLLNVKSNLIAQDFLLAKDNSVQNYINYASELKDEVVLNNNITLDKAIVTGQKHLAIKLVNELINSQEDDIVNKYVIPSLDFVGKKFEKGEFYLPQLISAADAAKGVIEFLQKTNSSQVSTNGNTFIIATVKDDVHDIGKNIVKAVVANYGFNVIDLGKDVSTEQIVKIAKKYPNCVVGLSALMTTTVKNMEETTKELLKLGVKVICGGAVLTEEYTKSFGGIYVNDANEAVIKLKEIFKI